MLRGEDFATFHAGWIEEILQMLLDFLNRVKYDDYQWMVASAFYCSLHKFLTYVIYDERQP